MKTHKIHGVDKSICTCEQKIAYNLAFATRETIIERELTPEGAVDLMMQRYQWSRDYKAGRYDEGAIEEALRNGFPAYRKRFQLASSYEQVGSMFPLS